MIKLRTIAPAPALRPYVSTYLFLNTGDKEDIRHAPPQLSSGLGFLWGKWTIRQEEKRLDLPPNYVIPITQTSFSASSPHPNKVVAAKFFPGRFYNFFGWPQDLFACNTVALTDTGLGQQAALLHEALDEAREPTLQAQLLDKFLLARLPRLPDRCYLIQSLLWFVYQNPLAHSLQDIPHRTRVSLRHLRRLFKKHTGLNARTFMRILRFYRAYFLLPSGRYTSLTDLALKAGYFDQAHFNRDFRQFTGYSPRAFLKKQHPEAALAWEGMVNGQSPPIVDKRKLKY